MRYLVSLLLKGLQNYIKSGYVRLFVFFFSLLDFKIEEFLVIANFWLNDFFMKVGNEKMSDIFFRKRHYFRRFHFAAKLCTVDSVDLITW